ELFKSLKFVHNEGSPMDITWSIKEKETSDPIEQTASLSVFEPSSVTIDVPENSGYTYTEESNGKLTQNTKDSKGTIDPIKLVAQRCSSSS
ncbi:MAG: hypothetical protein RR420_08565, partial [Anaerovoracaceae bacterium]